MVDFWLSIIPAVLAILIAIWAVRGTEDRERKEAAAQAVKEQLEAEAARNKPFKLPPLTKIDGNESNIAQLLALEDERERLAKRPEPKRLPTLRELLEKGERKRRGKAQGPSNDAGPSKPAEPTVDEKPINADAPDSPPSAKTAEKQGKKTSSKRNGATPQNGRRNKKRGIDEVTEYQDEESETSSRRVSKRLPKRNKRDDTDEEIAEISMRTTVPGGMEDIEVTVTTPEGFRTQRPKRRAGDLDEDSDDDDTDVDHTRRSRGRAVRRRRGISGSGDDHAMKGAKDSSCRKPTQRRTGGQNGDVETDTTDSEMDTDGPPRGLRATPFGETTTDEEESTEDEEFEGADDVLQTPRRRGKMPVTGSRKKGTRTATSVKKAQAAAVAAKKHSKIATPARVRGETWTERNGRRFKISAKDGKKRELVAVKEWRHKYNMPADSVHPDKYAMHQVLVEKWVTSAELDELQRCKLLGWQSDDEEPEQVDQIRMQDVGEKKEDPNSDLTQLNNSLYNYQPPQYVTSPANQAALSSSFGSSSSRKLNLGSPASLRPPTVLRAHRREPTLRSASFAVQQRTNSNTNGTVLHQDTTWNSDNDAALKRLPSSRNSLSDVHMTSS